MFLIQIWFHNTWKTAQELYGQLSCLHFQTSIINAAWIKQHLPEIKKPVVFLKDMYRQTTEFPFLLGELFLLGDDLFIFWEILWELFLSTPILA